MKRWEPLNMWRVMGWILACYLFIALTYPGSSNRPMSRVSVTNTQLSSFKTGLDLYELDMGAYPTMEQGLAALNNPPTDSVSARKWKGPYLRSGAAVPLDPWGRPYIYIRPGSESEPFEVLSYGKDGRVGGSGEAADFSSIR